ncbi:MAG: PTS sugar transporter subunit IIB [Deltaproteobacteria bacterium]|nr:PTS sugar transporter subunit IIB [Deltaproteobacteria bacterium]
MNSTFVRVDNRLVHGQIIEGWVPHLKVSVIVVVNDEVAGDFFRESVIRMSVPSDIEVQIYGVDDFARHRWTEYSRGRVTIVLFRDFADAVRAYDGGFRFGRLNIGNVHKESGKTCISASLFLDHKDLKLLQKLVAGGVDVEIQSIPRDKPSKLCDAVKKIPFSSAVLER